MRLTMQTWYVFSLTFRANKRIGSRLISPVKLTDFGAALRPQNATREDERVSALARRAQQGDYDKGSNCLSLTKLSRAHAE